jgi:glycosyltransferase involved in cell wall biosynthesis
MSRSVFLVGFSCDRDYFDRYARTDARAQFAAYKLESRFYDALVSSGFNVKKFSFFASSTYPNNKKIFFPYYKGGALPFINIPGLRFLSRVFVLFFGVLVSLWAKKGAGTPVIFVYSLHTPFLLAIFALKKLFDFKVVVIVPDLPEFMNVAFNRGGFFKLIKRIDISLIKALVRGFDGFVFLTKYMVSSYPSWKGKPNIVIEAIAEQVVLKKEFLSQKLESLVREKWEKNIRVVFYAGSLSSAYGVGSLIESTAYFAENTELWLCGAGDIEGFPLNIMEQMPVRILGKLSMDEVLFLQANVDLLVNPRPIGGVYTKYSFPSKLVEYMSAGIPVLTTKLPSIPLDYNEYLNFFDVVTAEGIANSIRIVFEDYPFYQSKARSGMKYVIKNKTVIPQGNRLFSFVESLKQG